MAKSVLAILQGAQAPGAVCTSHLGIVHGEHARAGRGALSAEQVT